MLHNIQGELIYLWYYFSLQFWQIVPYWIFGMLLGSVVSVFLKDRIHSAFRLCKDRVFGIAGIFLAGILGILSPLCMYGTIPVAASFSKSGIQDDWLAAFMMSSVLLNPQLIIYSASLGSTALFVRILSCYACGVAAGCIVHRFYRGQSFFDFSGFDEPVSHDTEPGILLRFLKNLWRNCKATGLYFLMGIVLSAIFQRYVPAAVMVDIFGGNEAWGVLIAATIGVPLYACGGGTIPLLQTWLWDGMSLGSAAAFMITGPATKITNLGAVKIVLGMRRFLFYLIYIMLSALLTEMIVNLMIG